MRCGGINHAIWKPAAGYNKGLSIREVLDAAMFDKGKIAPPEVIAEMQGLSFEACIAIQAQVSAVQAGNSRGELFKLLPAAPNP